MSVRVRFAPSPTGFMHIGNLRAALYNYLFAKHNDGVLVVRIEDTDQTRLVTDGVESIIKTLKWAGIDWDEGPFLNENNDIVEKGDKGPYVQSQRLSIYKRYVDELIENANAYYCFCTSECLAEMRKKQTEAKQPPMYDKTCLHLSQDEVKGEIEKGTAHVVRLKVPQEGETIVEDIIHGPVKFENKLIDDSVLLKSDGFPTYHLANIVDDHFMEITHVIRGDEWLPSAPKHILLYKAFGWTPPQFAHLPLLLNSDRSKLSKRSGEVSVEEYIKKGYLPQAIINFIALLGWNPRGDREVYAMDELIAEFKLENVNKGGTVVNFEKMEWINGEYIRRLSADALLAAVMPLLKEAYNIEERGNERFFVPALFEELPLDYFKKIIEVSRDRLRVTRDIIELSDFFLARQLDYKPEILVWKKSTPEKTLESLNRLRTFLGAVGENDWTAAKLENLLKEFIKTEDIGTGDTLWPMRVALTGREASPGPFETADVLGKERTLFRIDGAMEKIKTL